MFRPDLPPEGPSLACVELYERGGLQDSPLLLLLGRISELLVLSDWGTELVEEVREGPFTRGG